MTLSLWAKSSYICSQNKHKSILWHQLLLPWIIKIFDFSSFSNLIIRKYSIVLLLAYQNVIIRVELLLWNIRNSSKHCNKNCNEFYKHYYRMMFYGKLIYLITFVLTNMFEDIFAHIRLNFNTKGEMSISYEMGIWVLCFVWNCYLDEIRNDWSRQLALHYIRICWFKLFLS